MDDFDVLSFLSPATLHSSEYELADNLPEFLKGSSATGDVSELESEEDSSDDAVVCALDLPHLSSKPPASVLLILLKLLKPDQITNFGSQKQVKTIEEKLRERNIGHEELHETLPWFQENSIISTVPRLINLSNSIADINDYLTSIVSSSLSWITDDLIREQIWKESSLRLAEKCGRTAQPAFVRNITLPTLPPLKLNEPSLTSDNLGLKTWGSSLMLSKRIIKNPDLVREPVLELGSGTGLVGITCSLLQFQDVTLTDLPEIVPNLQKNVALNNLANAKVEILDWSDSTSFALINGNKKFNTIILSDPIYSAQHPVWVVDMLKQFLSPEGSVLLQIPIRINFADERQLFWDLLASENFKELDSVFENGYDDFGEQKFVFKKYIYRSAHSSSI